MVGFDFLGSALLDPDDLQALQDCLASIYAAVLDPSQWQAVMSVLAPFLLADNVHLVHLKRTQRYAVGAYSYLTDAKQSRDFKMWRAHAAFIDHLLRCPPLQIISTEPLAASPQEKQAKPKVEGYSDPQNWVSMAGMHFQIDDDWFGILVLSRGWPDGFIRSR